MYLLAMWEPTKGQICPLVAGAGYGLLKSLISGNTWKKIHKGLQRKKGEIGNAVSPSINKVYLL